MSRFQHHYFGAAFAEFLSHYAAGGAGADDADVKDFFFAQSFLPSKPQIDDPLRGTETVLSGWSMVKF